MAGFAQMVVEVGDDPVRVLPEGDHRYITLGYTTSHSEGGRFAKSVSRGPGAAMVDLHITGGSALRAVFNHDGSVDLWRTGMGVFKVALSMVWV